MRQNIADIPEPNVGPGTAEAPLATPPGQGAVYPAQGARSPVETWQLLANNGQVSQDTLNIASMVSNANG